MKGTLLGIIMSAPFLLFAQGFQVNLQGQKQTSMAGAGSALILDETTVFFNPGAMSLMKNNAIGAGINPLWFKSAFNESGTNTTEHVRNHIATPFAAYGVWGKDRARWKIGLGIYTPFGGLVDWGNSWSGKYALTSLDLKAIYFQPTVSYAITENLGIGAGFVYNHGEVNLQRALPITNNDGRDASAELRGKGKGYGWNAGIYYRSSRGLSLALVHRSKVITKLNNGDALFDVPSAVSASFPEGNKFSAELPLPATTTLGIAFSVSDKTDIAIDGSYVQWSIYKELAFDYEKNTALLQDTRSERNYRDGGSIKLGAQHQATDQLSIRAGVSYVFTPVKEGYVTPEAPDANRYILSAGAGYQLSPNWELNASFLFEDIKARSQTNLETGLSGTFRTFVFAPGIGISYKW